MRLPSTQCPTCALVRFPLPPAACRYNVKFTQWCGTLTRTFGHRATAPIKTFIDQVSTGGWWSASVLHLVEFTTLECARQPCWLECGMPCARSCLVPPHVSSRIALCCLPELAGDPPPLHLLPLLLCHQGVVALWGCDSAAAAAGSCLACHT